MNRLDIQPKRLALLVYLLLASPRGSHQRDKLIALFWPELDSSHARNSLSKALQVLRDQLGEDLIETGGASEVWARSHVITVDAVEFEQALARQQLEAALALYHGDLLDGFHVSGVSGFDEWLEGTRRRFRELAVTAARTVAAEKLDAGLSGEAVQWIRWAAGHSTPDETQVRHDLEFLIRAGDRAGALDLYRRFTEYLKQEFDAEPAGLTQSLAEQIRKGPGVRAVTTRAAELSARIDAGETTLFAPPRAPLVGRWGWAVPVLGFAVVASMLSRRLSRGDDVPMEAGVIRPFTTDSGIEIQPAISPDGKWVVYAAGPAANLKLFRRPIGGGASIPLTQSLPGSHQSPAWSPDGTRILFDRGGSIYLVPADGGSPVVVVQGTTDHVFRQAAWAPDGKAIAYVSDWRTLLVGPLAGGPARAVATGSELHSPAWSADGRLIAYAIGNPQFGRGFFTLGNLAPTGIMVVPAAGGPAVEIADRSALRSSPTWGPDGHHLLFVSAQDGARDLYLASLDREGRPLRPAQRVTTGLNAGTISLSASSGLLAYSEFHNTANLWWLDTNPNDHTLSLRPTPLTTGTEHVEFMAVSPDGRWLAFDSDRRGNPNLYRMRINGSEPQQITREATFDFAPSWSPDGKEIAFHSWRGGSRDIVVVSSEGGSAQPVVRWPSHEFYPDWSPDGRTLVFESTRIDSRELFLVTRDSTGRWQEPRQLTHEAARRGTAVEVTNWPSAARWSPRGPWIAYVGGRYGLQVIHESGLAGPRELLGPDNWPSDGGRVGRVEWTADGSGLVFNSFDDAESVSYWLIPVAGGNPRLLARFDHEAIYQEFALRDNRLFFTMDDRTSDIKVMEVHWRARR